MRRWSSGWLLLALVTLAGAARAQDERERALELGREGVALYEAGRWLEARERFERAEALVHSPVFVLYAARTQHRLGKLLVARTLYRRVIDEPALADEIEPWRAARRDAAAELEALGPRIPRIRVAVPSRYPAQVWLDGVHVGTVGDVIEADPGDHEVVVPVPQQPADEPSPLQERAAIGLLVTGGVLGLCALGTGLGAVVAEGALEDECPDGVCGAERADDVDRYYALAHTTTAMLVGGGAALGVGLVLYLTAPDADAAAAVGPGWAGFRAAF
jgi:hypothetical protein